MFSLRIYRISLMEVLANAKEETVYLLILDLGILKANSFSLTAYSK